LSRAEQSLGEAGHLSPFELTCAANGANVTMDELSACVGARSRGVYPLHLPSL